MRCLIPVIFKFLVFVIFIFGCQKGQSPASSKNKEIAAFQVGRECLLKLPYSMTFVDSPLLFSNTSHLQDTTDPSYKPTVSFHWDFGDMSASNERNPSHTYRLPGVYAVKLITYLDGRPSDTTSVSMQVIMGLREFKKGLYPNAIDMDQAADKGLLVLYSTDEGGGSTKFGFLGIDSLLRAKWDHPLPGANKMVRLSSIKRINNSAYILSGNYEDGNTNSFCLSKIDSGGNLIWSKYINDIAGSNNYTIPVSDGGFLTSGISDTSGGSYGAIIKCDANGNETWRRVFSDNHSLGAINNIIETDSGYVFSALSVESSPQIVVTELDYNGGTRKQKIIAPTDPMSPGNLGLLYNKNTFLVFETYPSYSNRIYLFDKNYSLLGSRLFYGGPIGGGAAVADDFVVYSYVDQYSVLNQVRLDGSVGWTGSVDPVVYLSCNTLRDGVQRTCRQVVYNADKEIIVLAEGENAESKRSLYLGKLTYYGELK